MMEKLKALNPAAQSLQGRLIAYFLLLSVLPVLAVLLALNRYYAGQLKTELTRQSEKQLHYIADNCYNQAQLSFKELYTLAIDPDFLALVQDRDTGKAELGQQIDLRLRSATRKMQGSILSVAVARGVDEMFYTRDRLRFSSELEAIFLEMHQLAGEGEALLTHPYTYKGRRVLFTAIPLRDFSEKVFYGHLIVGQLADAYEQVLGTDLRDGYTESLLASRDGLILCHPDPSLVGTPLDRYLISRGADDFSYAIRNLPSPDWQIVSMVDYAGIDRDVATSSALFYGVILVFVLLYLLLMVLLIRRVMGALTRLTRAMEAGHEDRYDPVPTEAPTPDVRTILEGYNGMTRQLGKYSAAVRRHHRKELEAMDLLREAEVKALELQINPHFLYNTLHTINCLAIQNDDYEVSEMIKYFSEILRYIVTDNQKSVSLREEKRWLEQYLTLQQKRFDNAFTFNIDIPAPLENCTVKKLLFQPLIENAILHGFEAENPGHHLTLRVRAQADALAVTIRDNGRGIDADTLAALQDLFAQTPQDAVFDKKLLGMGITNSWYRLHMYYGQAFSLSMESEAGAGTTVRLRLPKIIEREDA